MNLELFANCYNNQYGLNLKEFHTRNCRIDVNEHELIDAINNSGRISFQDGISTHFKLFINDNLVYLVGERSCYPCSHVVQTRMGEALNWVSCYVVPNGTKILGETDIRKSPIIISFYSELIPLIKNEEVFIKFLNNINLSFSECEWFQKIKSLSLYIRLSNFWDYKQKLLKLYENGLLYPLELALFNLYKGADFKTQFFIRYFIESLAESTNKIINNEEIEAFLNSLSSKEVETVFAIDEIRKETNLNILNDEYFADLLELDCERRYPFNNDLIFGLLKARQRVKDLFLVSTFRENYLKLLKNNFRLLENTLRKRKGFEQVGTFFMEKLLCEKLKTLYPKLKIISQYSPNWLFPQRFDMFIEDCNLAIEYNGAQHYKEIDFFGGKNGLKRNQELDAVKRQKCLANSICLWEIRYDEDFDLAFEKLNDFIKELLMK